MENLNNIIQLSSERIEKILRKETALTPDDINAVKELSDVIVNLVRLPSEQIERPTKVGVDEVIKSITDAIESAIKTID